MTGTLISARTTGIVAISQFARPEDGVPAFRSYDWYFRWMRRHMKETTRVFLVPCAATKPIYRSPSHQRIHKTFAAVYGRGLTLLVVSEPVVLIRYPDLSSGDLEQHFHYEFPPAKLSTEAREFFIKRLSVLLSGKNVAGCLPSHHAALVNDAIGDGWRNYWSGGLYQMMGSARCLRDRHKLYLS